MPIPQELLKDLNDKAILALLKLPPTEVIKVFKEKGYTFTWDWYETWQEVNTKVFTVAKAMRLDVLKDIRTEVQRAIDEGVTFEEFRKSLEPRLKKNGWWGKVMIGDGMSAEQVQLGSVHRLKTIFRTNLRTSYMTGRYKTMQDSIKARPYWQYIAILDSRTRPDHRALHGKVFLADDPIWDTLYPPNGWGCRCRVRALSEAALKRKGLTVSSSTDHIVDVDKMVSMRTGEVQTVQGYKDPATGRVTAPDSGWNYNVGKETYFPDIDKYPYDLAKQYVARNLKKDEFQTFYDGKIKGNYPAAVLTDNEMKLLGTKSQTVKLSSTTLKAHKEKHPEVTIEDYQHIPEIIEKGNIYQQDDNKLTYLLEMQKGDYLYRTAIKTTIDKKENYLLTLFKTSADKADKEVIKKFKKIR